jgi:hypothetical protein
VRADPSTKKEGLRTRVQMQPQRKNFVGSCAGQKQRKKKYQPAGSGSGPAGCFAIV